MLTLGPGAPSSLIISSRGQALNLFSFSNHYVGSAAASHTYPIPGGRAVLLDPTIVPHPAGRRRSAGWVDGMPRARTALVVRAGEVRGCRGRHLRAFGVRSFPSTVAPSPCCSLTQMFRDGLAQILTSTAIYLRVMPTVEQKKPHLISYCFTKFTAVRRRKTSSSIIA